MENNHANPVGITKDIYKITNNINGKVYIGQALNTETRFRQHCKDCAKDCLVDYAIKKYGKENFSVEILEHQICDYNEREKYWIKQLNSLAPNGYNISTGGDNPPVYYGIDHPNASIKSQEVLDKIISDLINTQDSYSMIAQRYGTNKKTVLGINKGFRYYNENFQYPLRQKPNINGKLTEDDIDDIIEELKHSYATNTEIGELYGVSEHTIRNINQGIAHFRENEEYPIRPEHSVKIPVTYNELMEIANLLATTNTSINQIAKQYNVSWTTVNNINIGSKNYFRREFTYPLRLPPHKK